MSHKRPPHDASRRYHDRVARQYDSIYDDPYWDFHDELTWRMIKPHLPRDMGAHCLDLGCGTGKWGLKFLKSGWATTFVDHAASMVEQARHKAEALGPKGQKATLLAADIVDLGALPDGKFALTVAIGDPISICSDPQRAAREMHRVCAPGGIVIATADNKLAALDHFAERGNLDALEEFIHTGKTQWLTANEQERFELTTFTPLSLRKLFERAGLEVLEVAGKTILPVRQHKALLDQPGGVERLLKLEADLMKDPASAGRAGHLQIIARRAAG
jgi:ubiquinone/menaquinone biosynthesis C-methylase UbiE